MVTQKNWRSPLILASALFSLLMVFLWVLALRRSQQVVAFIGAGYAILCLGFLAAQIVAFVRSHMDYDQTVEQPKFDIIRSEEAEWASE